MRSHIMELGLTYNLLTAYTSFVAVDRVVRNDGTELSRVVQPLVLPEGVSDEAVGDSGGGGTTAVEEQLASASWFGRQFYLSGGVWIDSEYTFGDPVVEYDAVRSPPAELKPFADLQREMIVVAAGNAYRLRAPALPIAAVLYQNVPNPFNAGTTIRFDVLGSQGDRPLHLEIFDLSGAEAAAADLGGPRPRRARLHLGRQGRTGARGGERRLPLPPFHRRLYVDAEDVAAEVGAMPGAAPPAPAYRW